MYFKPAPGDDPSLRVLEVKKNNYGPVTETIVLRWRDGVYVVERKSTLELLAAEAEIDHLFIRLLRRFTDQGRNVSDKSGTSYAPAKFAGQPEAVTAKITSKMFAQSMERLFAGRKIAVLTEGPKSHPRTRLVEGSTELPPPSSAVCVASPHNPPPGGTGKGALEAPARSTRPEGKAKGK
jgi:hypothetical protein